jgi:hypothetical protein
VAASYTARTVERSRAAMSTPDTVKQFLIGQIQHNEEEHFSCCSSTPAIQRPQSVAHLGDARLQPPFDLFRRRA